METLQVKKWIVHSMLVSLEATVEFSNRFIVPLMFSLLLVDKPPLVRYFLCWTNGYIKDAIQIMSLVDTRLKSTGVAWWLHFHMQQDKQHCDLDISRTYFDWAMSIIDKPDRIASVNLCPCLSILLCITHHLTCFAQPATMNLGWVDHGCY